MDILLATGNPHKRDELGRILYPHRILIPSEIGLEFDPEESGDTYLDNALIKARELAGAVRLPRIPPAVPAAGLPLDHRGRGGLRGRPSPARAAGRGEP